MKLPSRLFALVAVLAGVWFIAGCASPEGENLLTKAGFDPVGADTTVQIDALKKLGAENMFVVQRNGRTFYVVTDPPGGKIYVGTQADYARYRALRAPRGEAELPLVESQGALILNAWGGWKGWDA
jgi:hypothetical protein